MEMLLIFSSCLTVQVLSHHWVPPCRSNAAEMNAVTLGCSCVYSKENVRNCVIQAMVGRKSDLKELFGMVDAFLVLR